MFFYYTQRKTDHDTACGRTQVRLPPCCLYPTEDFLGNSNFPPVHSDCCWDTLNREIRVQSAISIMYEKY